MKVQRAIELLQEIAKDHPDATLIVRERGEGRCLVPTLIRYRPIAYREYEPDSEAESCFAVIDAPHLWDLEGDEVDLSLEDRDRLERWGDS